MRTTIAIVAAFACGVGGSAVAALSLTQTSVSNVPTSKADGVDATDAQCEGNGAFVDMPGLSTTFTLGGKGVKPVIGLFQGEWLDTRGAAVIRLLIDGKPQFTDGFGVVVAPAGTRNEFQGLNLISRPLEPGEHTATLQWKTSDARVGPVCAQHRSLIVLHK